MSRKTTVDELRGLMLQNTKAALESIESLRSENARLRVALTEAKTELHLRAVDALKPDPRVAVLEAELQAERVINQTISECQGAGGNECQCNVCILTRTVKTLGKENCDLHDKLIAAQRGEVAND